MAGADHEETAPDSATLAITKLACSLRGTDQEVLLVPGTLAHEAYGRARSPETFMCNYGVNESLSDRLFGCGLEISGRDVEGKVRIVERPGQPFWLATLFLPQLSPRRPAPHPLIVAFLRAAAAIHQQLGNETVA